MDYLCFPTVGFILITNSQFYCNSGAPEMEKGEGKEFEILTSCQWIVLAAYRIKRCPKWTRLVIDWYAEANFELTSS